MSYSPYLIRRQKALVIGSSSGIGEAVARHLAKAGTSIVINYHSGKDKAEKIVSDITSQDREAMGLASDDSDYVHGAQLYLLTMVWHSIQGLPVGAR